MYDPPHSPERGGDNERLLHRENPAPILDAVGVAVPYQFWNDEWKECNIFNNQATSTSIAAGLLLPSFGHGSKTEQTHDIITFDSQTKKPSTYSSVSFGLFGGWVVVWNHRRRLPILQW